MQNIGFIGLGKMGAAMAPRFLEAGFALTVWNRNAARAQPVAAAGGDRKVGSNFTILKMHKAILKLSHIYQLKLDFNVFR